MDTSELLRDFGATHPRAAALAQWSCLPVRVAPAFLRLARLRLLPDAGTGDEADLWLSELVESRSGAGFAFRTAVRDQLREALKQDGDALNRVWQTVHLEHAPWLSARTRLEEELTWRLLRDAADPAIEALWSSVVRELKSGDNAEGVARWVVRAVPDLPPGTLAHASGRQAFHGSHLLLGDASVLGSEPQRFLDAAEFAFATRRLPRRRLQVGLARDHLLLSPLQPIDNGHEIEIPATRPLWLQIEADPRGNSPAEVLTLADEAPLAHPLDLGEANAVGSSLRLIDGSLFMLRPGRATRPSITRNRTPRVQIAYEEQVNDTVANVHLPFVMGVLADLSGKSAEPLPAVEDRKFLDLDFENFDSRMKSMKPRVAFQAPNALTGEGNIAVDITFESMDDFSPAAVAKKVDALNQLLQARRQLWNLITYMDGKFGAEELIAKIVNEPALLESLAAGKKPTGEWRGLTPGPAVPESENVAETARTSQLGGLTLGSKELASLLQREFKPETDEAKLAIEQAVQTLAQQALAQSALIDADVLKSIQEIVAGLDRELTEQVNLIMHHEDFQKLEGAWRGLHYMVNNTETDEQLKIRVMNISKAELGETLRRFKGTSWDHSPVFHKIYSEVFGQFNGQPFGAMVGDYYFDQSPPDVELLDEMSKIAAAAHAPFITGASPTVMHMDSWLELNNPRDVPHIFTSAEYAAWRSLRESEDSRYLGLAMPRFLSRLPYGSKTNPVDAFNFEEDTGSADHGNYIWANAAYAMATNINRSFKEYGWCARIRGIDSGGLVQNLPMHAFPTDDDGFQMKGPTEIAITERREHELVKQGFMPLVHIKNTESAAFIDARSLHRPAEYDDPDSTANANLAARLPNLLVACRFAHHLMCMVRDKIGALNGTYQMQRWLQNWILAYVESDPATATEESKARRPLAYANVAVQEDEPGYYAAVLELKPHYQLEGLTARVRLVSKVPSGKVA